MDTSQYLEIFLTEAREHLQNLNQSLLELEANPHKSGPLEEIFRSAHTLKGMAATMGYEQIAQLTHEMENILSALRQQKIEVTASIVDTLFQCLDVLEQMLEAVEAGRAGDFPIAAIIERLVELGEGASDAPRSAKGSSEKTEDSSFSTPPVQDFKLNEYDRSIIKEARSQGFNVYHVVVEVIPESLMKTVRVFMVFKNLEEIGEIVKSVPPAAELEEGNFDREFELVLITRESQEVVSKKIEAISEVVLKSCLPLNIEDKQPEVTLPLEAKEARGFSQGAERSAASAPEEGPGNKEVRVRQTVRVDIERLDKLMNLVGELVINKTRIAQIAMAHNLVELNETVEQFDRISTDLQNLVMKVRMVPVEQVFNRFPRMVRDLAKELGKEINFVMEGKETELDRTVIDEIGDPLLHLLRNAIDHGIEKPEVRRQLGKNPEGLLLLAARHEGNSVIIEVEDDGQGLDIKRIRSRAKELGLIDDDSRLDNNAVIDFIFQPGFSTAQSVTDLSGRGVGLDVVRNKIESLSGTVTVESKPGAGTRFRIRLPLTLAIIQAMLVKVEGETYAIPLSSVDETTIVKPEHIRQVQKQEVILLRGQVLPILRLKKLVGLPVENEQPDKELYVVVVHRGNQQVGLVVDALIGQQEIVIKSLGRLLAGIPGLGGATILGDGKVSLILDVGTLF